MVFLRFIVLLLTVVANPLVKRCDCQTGITLELIHRDLLRPQQTREESLRRMLYRDMQRVVSSRKQRDNAGPTTFRRKTLDSKNANATAEATVAAGLDYGLDQYIVKLKAGTPPQDVLMVPDTGNDFTMLKCRHKGIGITLDPVFVADNSKSFTAVPCGSYICIHNLTYMVSQETMTCDGPLSLKTSICAYSNYSYAGGLSIRGIFANESFTFTLTNGTKTVLEKMPIGCSTSGQHLENIMGTHGILGLGNSPLSFPALASELFGVKFSMCLVDHLSSLSKISGKFIFGSVPKGLLPDTMSYTALDTYWIVPRYGLHISGIYINGRMVNISSDLWDNSNEKGGTVVDTGMSLTYLNELAYRPVTDTLHGSLSKFMKSVTDETKVFDYCYDSEGYNETLVPKLEIEFAGGVRLKPLLKSYLIDFNPTLKCLGFKDARPYALSVIGNILLQEHFVEIDVDNAKFGFGRSPCTSS